MDKLTYAQRLLFAKSNTTFAALSVRLIKIKQLLGLILLMIMKKELLSKEELSLTHHIKLR